MPDRADERRRAIWPARRLTGEKSRPDLVQGWGQGHNPGGSYAAVVEDGGLVEVSGMEPSLDGQVIAVGRVGAELTLEQAQ